MSSITERLSPEARAAVSVLMRLFDRSLPPVDRLGAEEDRVLAFLSASGLGGAFHKAMESGYAAGGAVSGFLRERAKELYFGAFGPNMARISEFARFAAAMALEGLQVMPIKGLVAAEILHGDLGVRPMSDADVLVGPSDVGRACEILRDMGYESAPMPLDPFVGEFGRHVPPMWNQRKKVAIEVHRRLDYPFSFLPDAGDVFLRARQVEIGGARAMAPSWEDFLYMSAFHSAYLDAFVGKLRDLFDLAVLMERHGSELDWDLMESFGFYILRPLRFMLECASEIFGSRPCREAAARIESASMLSFPTRRLSEDFLLSNLAGGRLSRRLPLSVLSSISFFLHCPELSAGFLGEFGRVFLFPDGDVLRRHYGGKYPLVLLRLFRPAHVFGIITGRLIGKIT